MRKSLVALWLALAASIASIVILALFWIGQREQSSRERVRDILASRLRPHSDAIARVIDSYSQTLERELAQQDLESLEDCLRVTRSPLTDAFIVVDTDAYLHFPSGDTGQSTDRRSLIDEAQQLLREQGDARPRRIVNNQVVVQAPSTEQLSADDLSAIGPDQSPSTARLRSRSYSGNSRNSASQPQLDLTAGNRLQLEENASSEDLLFEQQAWEVASGQDLNSSQDVGENNFGWITWYHRRGMVLGFWWHQGDQWRSIVALPRARWMADIVAALPDAIPANNPTSQKAIDPSLVSLGEDALAAASSSLAIKQNAEARQYTVGSLTQLVDVEGNLIYQWGDAASDTWADLSQQPFAAELPVANPLEGWRLRIYANDLLQKQLAGDQMVFPIWLAVGGMTTTLLLTGLIVSVSLSQQVRLAESRVSFVNQVSHELRTPLTNICMFADLLAEDIQALSSESSSEDVAPDNRQFDMEGTKAEERASVTKQLERLDVIQSESRRLNRLISNVLEFARPGKRPKPLRVAAGNLDSLIHEVVSTFMPRLESLGFEVKIGLQSSETRGFDADVVEQILVNLISNAEKYASSGKYLEIASSGNQDQVRILVSDHGPGVPVRIRANVFSAFVRGSDRLQDPAGTGIGLTIARELARRHGGDCVLQDTQRGAAFCCTLEAPIIGSESDAN